MSLSKRIIKVQHINVIISLLSYYLIISLFSPFTPQESERIIQDSPPGIKAFPHEENIRHFDVTIEGPSQSPYQDGTFKLELFLPEDYPMEPPKARFLTKIYHPNIDKLGRICLDILKGKLYYFSNFASYFCIFR